MRYNLGDRVRVAKSMLREFIGIEGIVVSIGNDDDADFTVVTYLRRPKAL